MLDLVALRHALAYNPVKAPRPIPVWLPPGGMDLLDRVTAPFDACDMPGRFAATVQVAEYDPQLPLAVGDAVVTFVPAVHYLPAWAMRVHATDGADLGYTGDTGPAAGLEVSFAGVGVLVAEATLLDPGMEAHDERGSLTATEAGALATAAGAETLVLTHMWEELGLAEYRARAAAVYSGRIEMAFAYPQRLSPCALTGGGNVLPAAGARRARPGAPRVSRHLRRARPRRRYGRLQGDMHALIAWTVDRLAGRRECGNTLDRYPRHEGSQLVACRAQRGLR
jgi:hypothetical protein